MEMAALFSCPTDVQALVCGSFQRYCGLVCIVRLWYFLIILHARTQEISSGERVGVVQAHLPQVFSVINLIYGSF